MTISTPRPAALSGSPVDEDGRSIERQERTRVRGHLGLRFVGHLEDAGLLLFVVFMVPLAILAIGTPVVLVVRLIVEIARRW